MALNREFALGVAMDLPLNDLEKTRRCFKFKEEALDRTLQGTRCGRGYVSVVSEAMELENTYNALLYNFRD